MVHAAREIPNDALGRCEKRPYRLHQRDKKNRAAKAGFSLQALAELSFPSVRASRSIDQQTRSGRDADLRQGHGICRALPRSRKDGNQTRDSNSANSTSRPNRESPLAPSPNRFDDAPDCLVAKSRLAVAKMNNRRGRDRNAAYLVESLLSRLRFASLRGDRPAVRRRQRK